MRPARAHAPDGPAPRAAHSLSPADRNSIAIALQRRLARGAGRRDRRHRRRRRQRPGRALRGHVGRGASPRGRRGAHRRRAGRPAAASTRAAGCDAAFVPEERNGHARGAALHAVAKTSCCRATRPAACRARPRRLGARREQSRPRSAEPSTCARARPDPRPARSPAAICRNSSSAARSDREPGVLVVNQPTWGVDAGAAAHDPAGADRSRRARLGRARDQPGPRRDLRDLRPDRRHPRRPAVDGASRAAR